MLRDSPRAEVPAILAHRRRLYRCTIQGYIRHTVTHHVLHIQYVDERKKKDLSSNKHRSLTLKKKKKIIHITTEANVLFHRKNKTKKERFSSVSRNLYLKFIFSRDTMSAPGELHDTCENGFNVANSIREARVRDSLISR